MIHIAKSTRAQCRIAYKEWAAKRVDDFIEQVQESNPAPVWDLAKRLEFHRTRPKIALAPVLNGASEVVRDPAALVTLWAQQFAGICQPGCATCGFPGGIVVS